MLVSASNLFNGSAQKVDTNTASFTSALGVIETILPARGDTHDGPSIFQLSAPLSAPNIIVKDVDEPVSIGVLPMPLLTLAKAFESEVAVPESAKESSQPKLDVDNVVGRILYAYEGDVSLSMHQQLLKIDDGLLADNDNVTLMGTYDAMLMMVKDGKVDLAKKISNLIVEKDPDLKTHAGKLAQEAQDNWGVVIANLAPEEMNNKRLVLS